MQRDFTYVDDIVEGVMSRDRPARAYRSLQHRQPPARRADALHPGDRGGAGRKAKLEMLPMQPGDVMSTEADTAALEAATGFRPSTPVEEGVRASSSGTGDTTASQGVQASISVRRVHPDSDAVTFTRIMVVATGAKLTVRLTRLSPVTDPTVVQALPFHTWTLKSVVP